MCVIVTRIYNYIYTDSTLWITIMGMALWAVKRLYFPIVYVCNFFFNFKYILFDRDLRKKYQVHYETYLRNGASKKLKKTLQVRQKWVDN